MKERFTFLYNKKVWLVLFLATFLLSWLWLPEELPLYYSFALRQDKLAGKYELLILPALVYAFFYIGEKWLVRLSLENSTMKDLIRKSLVAIAVFAYFIFLKIILLVI